jgi:hypothetical protein
MPVRRNKSLALCIALCVIVFIASVAFRVPKAYSPQAYYGLAVIQFGVIVLAAWKLGAWAIAAPTQAHGTLAAAGGLLFMPWMLFSFLSTMGAPGAGQTPAEEQFRYLVLLIVSMLVSGGFILLKEVLSEAGERFHSTLGFAAIVLAAPMYVIFTTVQLGGYHAMVGASPGHEAPVSIALDTLSLHLLFFAGVLTYLATAAFAAALGRIQWLGRKTTLSFVIANFFAMLCLVLRGLDFPAPATAFLHWTTTLGWIAGIPAVPWIMPGLFGAILLRRAGNEAR